MKYKSLPLFLICAALSAGSATWGDEDYGIDDPDSLTAPPIQEWEFSVKDEASSLTAQLSGMDSKSWQIESDNCQVGEVFANGEALERNGNQYARKSQSPLKGGSVLHALLPKKAAECKVKVVGLAPTSGSMDAQGPNVYVKGGKDVKVKGGVTKVEDYGGEELISNRAPAYRNNDNARQNADIQDTANVDVSVDQTNAFKSDNKVNLYITNIIQGDQKQTEVSTIPPAEAVAGFGDLKDGQVARNADGTVSVVTTRSYAPGTQVPVAGGQTYTSVGSVPAATSPVYYRTSPVATCTQPGYEAYYGYDNARPETWAWVHAENKAREARNFARYNQTVHGGCYANTVAPVMVTAPQQFRTVTQSRVYYAGYCTPTYRRPGLLKRIFGKR